MSDSKGESPIFRKLVQTTLERHADSTPIITAFKRSLRSLSEHDRISGYVAEWVYGVDVPALRREFEPQGFQVIVEPSAPQDRVICKISWKHGVDATQRTDRVVGALLDVVLGKTEVRVKQPAPGALAPLTSASDGANHEETS